MQCASVLQADRRAVRVASLLASSRHPWLRCRGAAVKKHKLHLGRHNKRIAAWAHLHKGMPTLSSMFMHKVPLVCCCCLVSPSLPQLVDLFRSYFEGALNENSVKRNFVLIYELLEETMDFGFPQLTGTTQELRAGMAPLCFLGMAAALLGCTT